MKHLPAIVFTFLIFVALGVIVGAIRALWSAIRAYRAARERGVAPAWAAGSAVLLGVGLMLATTSQLRNLRSTGGAQQPVPVAPQPPRPPPPPALMMLAVTITTNPPGAALLLNGEPLGPSPVTHQLQFDPSARRMMAIKASKPGYNPSNHYFTPSALSTTPLAVALQLERNKRAILRLTTEPREVEVRLDSMRVASVTPAEVELRDGPTQTLVIKAEGFITEDRKVSDRAGQVQSLDVTLRPGAIIEASCSACVGTLMFGEAAHTLPTRLTVEPNTQMQLVLAQQGGMLVTRRVVSGAPGTVTHVTFD